MTPVATGLWETQGIAVWPVLPREGWSRAEPLVGMVGVKGQGLSVAVERG